MTASPPADQPTPLRDRIAAALYDHSHPGWAISFPDLDQDQRDTYLARADAVLAVLPAPVDRAAVLREAADAVFALEYDVMVGEEGDESMGSMREAWDVGTIHASQLLRRMADQAEAELRRVADETATTETQADTLPAWLHWRFGPHGQPWAEVPDEDKTLWEHQARAVRRAVARGGFKQPAAGARQDGAQQ